MASVSLDNTVLLIGIIYYHILHLSINNNQIVGGRDGSFNRRREILAITTTGQWMEVGSMPEGRLWPAAAVVNFDKNQLDISACL